MKPALCLAHCGRRRVVAALAAAWLAGCGALQHAAQVAQATPPSQPAAAPPGVALDGLWRTVLGGFLAPPGAPFGPPARPGTGAFVRLLAPTALALQGNDLLIVDSGAGRVWRFDIALNTLTPIAGAPATPGTAVALGPDLSAWVLDPVSGQVLRFAREGRLLQTYRAGASAAGPVAPVGFTLADGGTTLLVADQARPQWIEHRPVGAVAIAVRPGAGDAGVRSVDGLAGTRDTVFVLDRGAAVVHVARRDGQLSGRLGEGDLKQPVAIAADRFGRVFVVDAHGRAVILLSPGRPAQVFDTARLRVQAIAAIAVDERLLAVADGVAGQVLIHTLREVERP